MKKMNFFSFILYALSFFCILPPELDACFEKNYLLPSKSKEIFDSYFQSEKLTASFFQQDFKKLVSSLEKKGFSLLARSNCLVVKPPLRLGDFVIKGPGVYHQNMRFVFRNAFKNFRGIQENVSRVKVANRINHLIKEYSLKHVRVPRMFFYPIPGAKKYLNDNNYLVVEESISIDSKRSLYNMTLNQLKEVLLIVDAIGYSDTHCDNIVFDTNGKLVFLDTSDRSYLNAYMSYDAYSLEDSLFSDSYEWKQALKLLESKQESFKKRGFLIYKKIEVLEGGVLPFTTYCKKSNARQVIFEYVKKYCKEIELLLGDLYKPSCLSSTLFKILNEKYKILSKRSV